MPDDAQPFPFGMGDLPSDAPLFRELQRVLRAGGGAVNWELARQVGAAAAASEGEPPPASDAADRAMDAVRLAELRVADLTGHGPLPRLADVMIVDRATWTRTTLEDLRPVLEPALGRMASAISRVGAEGTPEGAGDVASAMIGQLSPLLLGAQVGSAIGEVARSAFATYDVPLPRGDAPLRFLGGNVARFAADWSLEPVELWTWLATRESARRIACTRPWMTDHVATLLDDWSSTLRIDADEIGRRLASLDPADPDAMKALLAEGGGLGPVMDEEQVRRSRRIEALVAAIDGFAETVADDLATGMLPTAGRIREAVGRHGVAGAAAVARLLGVDVPPDAARLGAAFCRAVVDLTDHATLARMWDDRDALPSWPEIEEPRLWLARTA